VPATSWAASSTMQSSRSAVGAGGRWVVRGAAGAGGS